MPTVGSSCDDRTKINVTSGRQEIDVIGTTARVRASVNKVEIGIEQSDHDAVGIIVVIPIARCLIEQLLPQAFLTQEIVLEGSQKSRHIEGLFIKDMVLDGGHGIRQGAQAHSLDIR